MADPLDNTQRFTGRAQGYDRFRQRYPADAVLHVLRTWCSLQPDWRIADIGAGTGMLSRVFLENGNRVLAIEPNADMREQMQATFGRLGKCWGFEIRNATAEATTLPNASVEMVAAGRAFHWFDHQRALAEFHRILKPQGWIALVSLGRAHDESEQTAAFERLLIDHGTDYKYIRGGYRIHDDMSDLFGADAELHQAQIRGAQQLDWPTFQGQTMSLSVVPQPEHANYKAFQRELRRFFDSHASDGILVMPTTCWVTAARLATAIDREPYA